jgi:hypothetical protein
MNIVKQSTGNVVLTDTAGNILKAFISVNALDVVSSNEIIIKYGMNQWTTLFANQIDNTQIEPAGAIPFNGDAYQLATLLSSDFFFDVSGGGGAQYLYDLQDVNFPNVLSTNQILTYNNSTTKWENITINNILGYTPAQSDGFNIIVKSANQDVNNNTLTDDTDFQFPVVAGGTYMLQMVLATSSDSNLNDYKFAFAVSSGTINGVGNVVCRNASNSPTVTVISANVANITNSVVVGQNTGAIPSSSGIVTATVDFGFYASANGVLKFQFALNNGSTTARTWKGSVLKYKRLD